MEGVGEGLERIGIGRIREKESQFNRMPGVPKGRPCIDTSGNTLHPQCSPGSHRAPHDTTLYTTRHPTCSQEFPRRPLTGDSPYESMSSFAFGFGREDTTLGAIAKY